MHLLSQHLCQTAIGEDWTWPINMATSRAAVGISPPDVSISGHIDNEATFWTDSVLMGQRQGEGVVWREREGFPDVPPTPARLSLNMILICWISVLFLPDTIA